MGVLVHDDLSDQVLVREVIVLEVHMSNMAHSGEGGRRFIDNVFWKDRAQNFVYVQIVFDKSISCSVDCGNDMTQSFSPLLRGYCL